MRQIYDGLLALYLDRQSGIWDLAFPARHEPNGRAGGVLAECGELPAGTVLDGELVAIAERDSRPVPDSSAVRRAVFNGDPDATATPRYVAFDLFRLDGQDLRDRRSRDRDEALRAAVPQCRLLRLIDSQPATQAARLTLLTLGFEGSVLKRARSLYRAGRQSAWRKLKARHTAPQRSSHYAKPATGRCSACATSTADA